MQTVIEKIKSLKIKRIGCACLLLALLPAVAVAGAQTLDEQVDRIFRDAKTVGGAFLVAQEGEIVYERYYGEQQKTTHVPVTEKSYFRCASVTKLVTGIGLMRMMDDGLLDPDEDISVYLGYEAGNPRYPDVPITLRMLMSHTSGLNENSSYSSLSSKLSDMIALDKKAAADFSFLMSIPAILGGAVLEAKDAVEAGSIGVSIPCLLVGMLAAGVTGYFAVNWMLKIIKTKKLWPFALYTGVLGIIVIILQFMGLVG